MILGCIFSLNSFVKSIDLFPRRLKICFMLVDVRLLIFFWYKANTVDSE